MYAMTKNSRRARGQAVACDLVRVALRGANKLSAIRHNEAVRARLSEGFGGYLVTEPEEMTYAEYLACWHPIEGSLPGAAFSKSRAFYSGSFDFGYECMTGDGRSLGLDAPELLAAGSMRGAEFGGFASVVVRGAWK